MKWKPYTEYKDSPIPAMPLLPSTWSVCRLGFLTTKIGSGKTPSGGAEVYLDEGVLFIRSQNVYDEGLRLEDVAYISDSVDEEMANTRVRGNDILLNITGASLGRSCIVPDGIGCANVNQHVCIIRLRNPSFAKFVSYVLMSIPIKAQIDQAQNGAAREGLNFDQISKLGFLLPPDGDRDFIVKFLDRETAKIDSLIAEQRTLIERLREKRQSVLTTGMTKGLDPDVPMRDSGIPWIGDIPAHWSVIPLKKAIDFQEGPGIMAEDFRDEGVPLLRVGNVSASMAMLEGCNYLDPAKVQSRWNHFKLSMGDLLISASASMGTVCEVGAEAEGSIAYTGIIRLREVSGISFKGFLRHFVVSYPYLAQIDTFKAGTAIQHYGPVHLKQMFFICPSVDEQKSIALHIDRELKAIDRLIAEAETSIALLQEHRSALITAVVTGKVDVREAKS